MSKSIESVAAQTGAASSRVAQGELHLPVPMLLHFGGRLDAAQVAWRLEGAPEAPVVLVLGGISAGRHVAASDDDTYVTQGWWKEVMGPGRALDTQRYRILGIDFLGGSGMSTGPKAGDADFPSISAFDQVAAIKSLLAALEIPHLHAVIGASYGGMVALAMGEREPKMAQRLVVISAAHRTHPMATAWRSVQRAIVRYAISKHDGGEGLRLARALAMATYRSQREFEQRFSGEAEHTESGYRFPVEKYLFSRGDAYKSAYVPESFVCLSESIDMHRINPAAIHVPTTLVAIIEDQLVPLADMRALHDALPGTKQLIEVSSLYGHDAFLKETDVLRRVFADALK